MKVRIGNDICLHVTLLGNKTTINVEFVRAYLINTSRKNDIKELMEGERRAVRYISRFPAEPHDRAYRGTPYDLCHSGRPTFHVRPVCVIAPYVGFGVYPHSFDPFRNHLWAYGCEDEFCDKFPEEKDHMDIPDPDKYRAIVKATGEQDKIDVYFPAEDQLHTGTYKLVIVAKVYEPGYSPNNLRTVTMDYQEVFTIVGRSDEADVYESVNIEVGNLQQASDINITGTFAVGVAQQGSLTAIVSPAAVNQYGVMWEVLDNGLDYITKNSESEHTLVYSGLSLPEGVNIQQVRIKVSSKKTPSISKIVTITVSREGYIDKYAYMADRSVEGEGNNKKAYINLHIAGSNDVTKIDTTNETVWYEGD